MTTMMTNFALVLLIITMTSYSCRSCQFPVYAQSAAPEARATGRRNWQARSRSQSVPRTPMQVLIEGGTLSWKALDQNGDGEDAYVDQCLEQVTRVRPVADPLFVVTRNDHLRRSHHACVTFRLISPEVVLLDHVITADTCDVSKFNYSTAWLLVDNVALYEPLPGRHRPCALRGGFQMRISGADTGNKGAENFRKCGSFVEMRVESDCANEFGMYFDFRLDVCVPEGLFMYTRQRTLCVSNWTVGPYTFVLVRHELLPYSWIVRYQTSLEDSFVAYLLIDLVDDVGDVPASRYFRLDMVRSATVPATSLCVDESEVCASTAVKGSPRCDTENTETAPAPAMTCPRACGLCNATRPSICRFPSQFSGTWSDGGEPGFQLFTAANRKSITILIASDAVKQRFYCIQWEVALTSTKRPTPFNEVLMVNDPTEGCRRRYLCARVLSKSSSVMYFRLTKSRTWPFTLLPSDPIDCSAFHDETRFRVLISRRRRDPVACHLPSSQLTNYSVTFDDGFRHFTCDASVIVRPEVRHRLLLRLAECSSAIAGSEVIFDCLDSMLAPASGDVIIVTYVASSPTSGSATSSSRDSVIKLQNFSSFGAVERQTTANSTVAATSSLAVSSSFLQDSIYCWVFPRASFPHEFHIVPGSQCSDAAMTSSRRGGSGAHVTTATFVRTRVRSPRLYAADRRPTVTTPSPRQPTSRRPRDSKKLSAVGHNPDVPGSDAKDWQKEQPGLLRTTVQTEPREAVPANGDEEVSVLALLAAAVVFAFMQCAFLCVS